MYEIAIPSYKRPTNCKTAKMLTRAVIYVHEFEVEEYKKNYKNKIVAIPDDLQKKGMATIRNFILDNAESDHILMIDDDLNGFGYHESDEYMKMKEKEIYAFIEMGFRMCEGMETVLWGVNLTQDRKFYRESSPLSLSAVILGPFMGIIRTELRFDERLGLKEDYDYSLMVLNKYRRILRMNKYHYISDHIKVVGGCATYRTAEIEEKPAEALQRKWGRRIVKIKRVAQGGNMSINPVVLVPINGI